MGTKIVRRVLIDGDYVVYSAGFAGQHTEYVYLPGGALPATRHDSIGEVYEVYGKEIDRANLFARTFTDPPAHIFHTAKIMLEKIEKTIREKFPRDELDFRMYIDGDGNFRQKLATIRPYKALRGERPVFYHELREYLRRNWGAMLVHDQETDDAISIAAHAAGPIATPVIVAVDKDLLQIPGMHYNPNKGWAAISPELAECLLYRQCLTGDSTDNIGGCYRCGAVTAKRIITPDMTENTKWAQVLGAYQHSVIKYGEEIYNGLTADDAAVENMQLVFLRTRPDETWIPPGERKGRDAA